MSVLLLMAASVARAQDVQLSLGIIAHQAPAFVAALRAAYPMAALAAASPARMLTRSGGSGLLRFRLDPTARLEQMASGAWTLELRCLRSRSPWLTGADNAPAALSTPSLPSAVLDRLTLRSSRDSTAWMLRVGGTQVTLKRRF